MTTLQQPMSLFRTGAIRQDVSKGVDTQAGVIRGAKVIQLGDVNDSRPWYVDQETMAQVVKFGNQPNKGLKARFTHPNMSDDGMGKYLGRWQNFRIEGDSVLADLHLSDSAAKSPSGDLKGYVLQLAADDPEAFGVSVATKLAPEMFQTSEKDDTTPVALRLVGLYAADVVDEPAATRGGLFDLESPAGLPALASWIVETHFADREPEEVGKRLLSFLSRYYGRDVMADVTADKAGQAPEQPKAPEATPAVSLEAAKPYMEAFGDRGAAWFLQGKTMSECFAVVNKELQAKIEALQAENKDLATKLEAAKLASGEQPLSATPPVEVDPKKAEKAEKVEQFKKQGAAEPVAKLAASFAGKVPKI